MEEEIEEQSGPSMTLSDGVPCFIMPDGTVLISQAPELFDTEGGAIGLADGYMTLLSERYDSVEAMREHAVQVIEQQGLLDHADSDAYSIWLLVWMTV